MTGFSFQWRSLTEEERQFWEAEFSKLQSMGDLSPQWWFSGYPF
jgi:hypothetical protein